MDWAEIDALLAEQPDVRASGPSANRRWTYHGRLVARRASADELVIRTDLARREALLAADPATFTVPTRYRNHQSVVATLRTGRPAAIRAALHAARQFQAGQDS